MRNRDEVTLYKKGCFREKVKAYAGFLRSASAIDKATFPHHEHFTLVLFVHLLLLECDQGTFDAFNANGEVANDFRILGNKGGIIKDGPNGRVENISKNIVLYEKISVNKSHHKQWFGWKSNKFTGQTVRVTVWLKFDKKHEKPVADNFGIKICGTTSNEFLDMCDINKWCYATVVGMCNQSSNDNDRVMLTFNGMPVASTVYISQLKAQILQCSKFICITRF